MRGDELPKSLVASAVALADKFDTLTGIFGIGQAPKGSADPFALRRAALGALRIIVEKNLPLDLEDLVKNQPHFSVINSRIKMWLLMWWTSCSAVSVHGIKMKALR